MNMSRGKYDFGLKSFTSKEQMKAFVQPDPRDGRVQPETFEPSDVGYLVLKYALDGSPARGDYPAEDPAKFLKEKRLHEPTGKSHFGWLPVWSSGVVWPFWSYRHGFGGDYYGRVVRAAMRFEVSKQVEDVRFSIGDGMHVHHEEPNTFAVLASAWLGRKGLMPKYVELEEPHPTYKQFKDRALAEDWQRFHAENATLVLLTPEEHRALHSGG